jgi:hypothetical protein
MGGEACGADEGSQRKLRALGITLNAVYYTQGPYDSM